MPKYYIRDSNERTIISAHDPITACAKALVLLRFSTVMAGGWYWVSERGFDIHPDGDQKIDSDEVNEKYMELWP